jgi:hypothetical protein
VKLHAHRLRHLPINPDLHGKAARRSACRAQRPDVGRCVPCAVALLWLAPMPCGGAFPGWPRPCSGRQRTRTFLTSWLSLKDRYAWPMPTAFTATALHTACQPSREHPLSSVRMGLARLLHDIVGES